MLEARVARIVLQALNVLALALLSGAAAAQAPIAAPASPPPMEADPIATELQKKPAPVGERVFSPSAISNLLQQNNPTPTSLEPSHEVAVAANAKLKLTPAGMQNVRFAPPSGNSKVVDPVVLKAEILLDRAHAPPGVIDGRLGGNVTKAIAVFEQTHGLPVDGKLSRAVWDALGGDNAAPVLGTYEITKEDLVGPFYPDLPSNYADLAKLPTSGYHSPAEMFGERFHMDKKFLVALNPGADLAVAGTKITVALVESLPLVSKIARIDVDKAKGQVQAYDAQNNLIVAYPATIGSDELPSPSGSYTVKGVAWHPVYSYDPKKNFQQGANTEKLTLPAGPNNPVGAVFIALSKPTYGIHGTPDPSKIDKTRSHGCVRLTNWNAQELAHIVRFGIPVNFLDKPGEGATEAAVAAPSQK
jgi:lipoprotein-anchoring transpeptidase ErfK/SrfK